MSQDDLEIFLRQNSPKSYTTKELAGKLSLSTGTINLNGRRLVKWNRIRVYKDKVGRCFYHIPLPTGHSRTKHINSRSDR